MVQGTGSGVGKSLIATAFCRLFARAGYRVAPFKSQNMALNAAVTADGAEIGRAQAAQAEAAGVEPTVDMNPILLKPEADHRSQLVVHGIARATVGFREYQRMRADLAPLVLDSLGRLRRAYDLVVIEGAGSPAEINLADTEIVNMFVARHADARVVLVGDIERGGVFAALVGTMALVSPEDRARVGGFVINKFRGDPAILNPGLRILIERTGVPVLGVVPALDDRLVPAEDSLDLEAIAARSLANVLDGAPCVDIAVVRLPRIANFDDFEPLAVEPGVRLRWVTAASELDAADLIVLPGSKGTVADLNWLTRTGLAQAIRRAAADGRYVLGVCGGYQMLGRALLDPQGVDGSAGSAPGLGLLPVVTTFARPKRVVRVRARVTKASALFERADGSEIGGYEIHAGRTLPEEHHAGPFVIVHRDGQAITENEGAISERGNVGGTYLHGVFADSALRRGLVAQLPSRRGLDADPRWGAGSGWRPRYERLADLIEAAVDMTAVARLVGLVWCR
jgi:adenosylcobyric acid synthase